MPALSPEHLAQFIGVGLKRVDVDLTRFEPLAFVGLVIFHPELPSSCSDGGIRPSIRACRRRCCCWSVSSEPSRAGVPAAAIGSEISSLRTYPFSCGVSPQLGSDRGSWSELSKSREGCAAACLAAARWRRAGQFRPPRFRAWNSAPRRLGQVEPVPGYPRRPVPRAEDAAKALRKRTLTNLYNARPQWLADANAALDAAVAGAYGWPADISGDHAGPAARARHQPLRGPSARTPAGRTPPCRGIARWGNVVRFALLSSYQTDGGVGRTHAHALRHSEAGAGSG